MWLAEAKNPATLAGLSFKDQFLTAWFQSVTTRTAGFNSIDITKMTAEGWLLMMPLMFIGASPSGTGGGIKTTTTRIIAICTRAVLRGHEEVVLYKREVPTPLILKSVTVVFGSVLAMLLGVVAIAFIEPEVDKKFNIIQVIFEVISAFCTVGLSTGITAALSSLSQLVLILMMYVGRVGIILFMAAIVGDPQPSSVNYPEENLLVG
jgi:trk system potassium uptake protein TrkH